MLCPDPRRDQAGWRFQLEAQGGAAQKELACWRRRWQENELRDRQSDLRKYGLPAWRNLRFYSAASVPAKQQSELMSYLRGLLVRWQLPDIRAGACSLSTSLPQWSESSRLFVLYRASIGAGSGFGH